MQRSQQMILVSHLELVWRGMRWKFVNAQVITVYTLMISSQATNDFFSSYESLSDLDKKDFQDTGSMRKDRDMKFPLIDMKQMKRKERKSYDYRSYRKIEVVWWNDN